MRPMPSLGSRPRPSPWRPSAPRPLSVLLLCAVALSLPDPGAELRAQASTSVEDISLRSLEWRNVGPNRGGRSIAVAGTVGRRNEYYFGATGG